MSKKRKSPESNNDEQTNEDSDSVFQQDGHAKRAKLSILSDPTFQDLPIELIECILVKAVAMEVKGMKLAKSVWKEKADLVISRLRTVCSQWGDILTTNSFRNELQRTLEGTAQKTIRLEILHQFPLQFKVRAMTTMKDEIFMLGQPEDGDYPIYVCDRNNLAQVKDIIPLEGIYPNCMKACSVSNCLYILCKRMYESDYIRILRITKDAEQQFNIIPLITDVWMPNPWHTLSVAADGSLIFKRQEKWKLPVLSIYNADGSVQREMTIHSGIPKFYQIVPKSNGNLVLLSINDQLLTTLTEIDMDVKIVRQYQSSQSARSQMWTFRASHADVDGHMLLGDHLNRIELLDSELNLLDFTGAQLDEEKALFYHNFHYNSERNEVVASVNDQDHQHGVLTIFRFKEE